jgi:hypothetical protein
LELFALNDEGFDGVLKEVFEGLGLGFVEGGRGGLALTLAMRVAGVVSVRGMVK